MPLVATGLEILSIERLRGLLARRGARFRERVFTSSEQVQADSRADPVPALAARLAAKLALRRALRDRSPVAIGLSLREIEVVSGGRGAPQVRFRGGAAERLGDLVVSLSLSHDGGVALASVYVETQSPDPRPSSASAG